MKKTIFIFLTLFLTIFISLTNFKIETKKQVKTYTKKLTKEVININRDIIGHLTIASTNIDYDITKTTDNKFYLNHNAKKEKDKNGSIFMDYRNNLDDQKLLIYGHNSKYEQAPLKELENYLEEDYFKNNNTIKLTLNNKEYLYQIFSIIILNKDDYRHTKIQFNEEEYQQHLNWLQEESLYKSNLKLDNKANILTIQTCYYYPQESFLIISAKRSDDYEKI